LCKARSVENYCDGSVEVDDGVVFPFCDHAVRNVPRKHTPITDKLTALFFIGVRYSINLNSHQKKLQVSVDSPLRKDRVSVLPRSRKVD